MADYINRESRTFIEIADDLNDLVSELNDKIMDGHTYTDSLEFSESKFKDSLKRGICYNCKHLKKHNGELAEFVCDIKGSVVNDTRIRECDDMWESMQTERRDDES